MAVAARLFFENGFSATTMQMIAERAGASKETLYRHFGNKEELFAEVVSERASSFLVDVDRRFEQRGSVEVVLRSLGCKLLETMIDAEAISLCRVVISERSNNPSLGEIFMQAGPNRVLLRLTEFIAAASERGELTCKDAATAARLFLGSVFGTYHLTRLILQEPPKTARREVDAHISEAVTMFMMRFGAGVPAAVR